MTAYPIGAKVERIEIIGPWMANGRRGARQMVRCQCGKEWSAAIYSIRRGEIKSCGCLRAEKFIARNTTHGLTPRGKPPPEYTSWADMIQRCCNPNSQVYRYYGARGIAVCDRWRSSFECFLIDMGPRPPNHSLERVDNMRGYDPGNCEWATRKQQARNTRSVKLVMVDGVEMPTSEAAIVIGVPQSRIFGWVFRRGWTHQRAVDHCREQIARAGALGAMLGGPSGASG